MELNYNSVEIIASLNASVHLCLHLTGVLPIFATSSIKQYKNMNIYRIEKISYSRVGVTCPDQPRKVEYLPIVSIIHDEKGAATKSKVYLEKVVESKKYYRLDRRQDLYCRNNQ